MEQAPATTLTSNRKHPFMRKSIISENECMKELEKMYANKHTMSRHRQI